jgi:hypothetical protein
MTTVQTIQGEEKKDYRDGGGKRVEEGKMNG